MVERQPRERLLDAVVDYSLEHGITDLSLRELAEAVGTSHRMLIYHFGSKEGLLVAVVERVEAAQRELFLKAIASGDHSPTEAARQFWRRVADPRLWPQERLFFEIYVHALLGRPGTEGFLDGVVSSWTETAAAAATDLPRLDAEADARLGVAVVRGLLLDLLATGDRRSVNRAFERYLEAYQATHA